MRKVMALHPHYLWADIFHRRKAEKSPLIDLLRENILFCTLTKSELRYLSSLVYERIYQPDEAIFQQNSRGFGMYMIVKGRVTIKTQANEGEHLMTHLGKGSFFGELALVDPDNIRSATATATERTVLIGFFKPDLMEILERRPSMGVKILYQLATILGQRLLETTEKVALLSQARGLGQIHGDAA